MSLNTPKRALRRDCEAPVPRVMKRAPKPSRRHKHQPLGSSQAPPFNHAAGCRRSTVLHLISLISTTLLPSALAILSISISYVFTEGSPHRKPFIVTDLHHAYSPLLGAPFHLGEAVATAAGRKRALRAATATVNGESCVGTCNTEMSSMSNTTPILVRLMTLPVEPHAMPSQLWQQSNEGVQESSSFGGSKMILLLNSSNASLSTT
ncbi:hypothetical protein LR48_Vigan03g080200 [Vigna angularis]|uniref:Uncharacterized protein n=1 Tax=Phaseolus angularis TaxID=3914 RepID=A0A0L9U3Q0_PHAAN|nr:hypothetical protein LR48_Vigan03g080200 [Vigna angularis]